MPHGNKYLTNGLRRIRNARWFWFNLAFLSTSLCSRNRPNTTMPRDKATERGLLPLSCPLISPDDCPAISDGLLPYARTLCVSLVSTVGCNEIAPLILCLISCTKAVQQMVQCAALIAPYVFRKSAGGAKRYTLPRQQKGRSAPRILYNAPL
ncbi:hypothetical protein D3C79_562400 [compost metagenome]